MPHVMLALILRFVVLFTATPVNGASIRLGSAVVGRALCTVAFDTLVPCVALSNVACSYQIIAATNQLKQSQHSNVHCLGADQSLRVWMRVIQEHVHLSTIILHPLYGTLVQIRTQVLRWQLREHESLPISKKPRLAQKQSSTCISQYSPYGIEVIRW
jgi:hypothetical protein